jgi:Coenzyme PQQ synthesis protein D (PqqD)
MSKTSQAAGQDSTVRPSPDVVARRLDRAGVLVHLPTNRIFELNETGMRVWELLSDGESVAKIVDRLVMEFDVDAPRATREVNELLVRFGAEGFIRR